MEANELEKLRKENIELRNYILQLERLLQTGELMSYSMTTIYSNTKIREDHNTAARILTSAGAKVTLSGSEIWTAPADGVEVKKGDIWMRVTYNGVTGWMAHIHKGQFICNNFTETVVTPPVPNAPIFPESFTLTDPQGNQAEYVFVKLL